MTRIPITSAKVNIVFPEGKLPAIDPAAPEFVLELGGVAIRGKVTPKAARKLAAYPGGAVLQGRLVAEGAELVLNDAGFTFLDPRPATPPAEAEGGPS
jgi:hypothetical protein